MRFGHSNPPLRAKNFSKARCGQLHPGYRFLEFFAANIRNTHTRRAYYRAAEEFLDESASAGVPSIAGE